MLFRILYLLRLSSHLFSTFRDTHISLEWLRGHDTYGVRRNPMNVEERLQF